MKFQRSLSSMSLLFAAVGSIIGSGWLFGSLYAAQVAGPAAILSWIIGGILMIVIGLTFAELATAFPVAGGVVRFAEFSHGPLMSFTIGWMVWLSSVVVAPVETLALIQYSANYVPSLMQKVNNNTPVLTSQGMVVAAVLMFIMSYLNLQGAKFFSRVSDTMVIIKLFIPVLVLMVLFYLDFHSENFHAVGGFMPYGWHGVLTALPLGGVIFAFIGYSSAIQLAEEAKNPQVAIPLAIIGSLVFCIILYVLLQIAFVGALKPEYLQNGWTHLSFKGDTGPFAGILAALGAYWLVIVIYAGALVSPFSTAYIYTAATARVSYAMCQTGFFPEALKKLNKHGIPMRAIMVNYLVGLVLFLPFPGWQSMVTFIISCFVISFSIGPIALMTLRQTHAEHLRPFRLPVAKAIAGLAFYICNLLIFWTGWHTVARLLIALAIGFFVLIYRRLQSHEGVQDLQWIRAWWLLPYFMGVGVISYLGTFGSGIGIIKFGYDFIVIALFSWVIYYFAIKSAKPEDAVKINIEP